MKSNNCVQLRVYVLSAAWVAFVAGVLLGLCGAIAMLSATSAMTRTIIVAFCLLGLAIGCALGVIGWAIRAPVALSQLGAAYALAVGLLLVGIIENLFTGGENTGPISFLDQVVAIMALAIVAVLVGSIPNLLWLIYSRLRSTDNQART